MDDITKDLTLEQRLARVEAYIEIQNVMSAYAYFHSANRDNSRGKPVTPLAKKK